jgi:hypothetical protein
VLYLPELALHGNPVGRHGAWLFALIFLKVFCRITVGDAQVGLLGEEGQVGNSVNVRFIIAVLIQ